jgi:hypothetical protein
LTFLKTIKTTGAALNNIRVRAALVGAMLSISKEDGYLIAVWRKSVLFNVDIF